MNHNKDHVRFAKHIWRDKNCSMCPASFKQLDKFNRHYCTVAKQSFEKRQGDVYVQESKDTDLYRVGKSISWYDRFKLWKERKVTFDGTFPLLSIPKGHRHLPFEDNGDRSGNAEYKKILKEKILKGEENRIVVPKKIKIVDKLGVTKFYLDENVLKPTSKKLLVRDVDEDNFEVSLAKPPKYPGKRTPAQFIIDSLKRLRSYMDFSTSKGYEHEPHEYVVSLKVAA